MLFNSWTFFVFFLLFYPAYRALGSRLSAQKLFLLAASCFFYGSFDWRFLGLLLLSSMIAYSCSLKIAASKDAKAQKIFLALSIAGDLGILIVFKYAVFFVGIFADPGILPRFFHEVVLPAGISFYTFQSIGYAVDVYRGEASPPPRYRDYVLFVSFFPHLVVGPIQRTGTLLPQILSPKAPTGTQLSDGAMLVLWGLFQKIFIADNLAVIVDRTFSAPAPYRAVPALIGVYAFSMQLYGDFAGYSNIARGLSKLMGYELMVNFDRPYLAANPQDFWHRWHISLSSWFRDYVYIPLGGNKRGNARTYLNLMVMMTLAGLWHGAAWKYVVWGAYQGALLVVHRFTRNALRGEIPMPRALGIFLMFNAFTAGHFLFRANDFAHFASMAKAFAPANFTLEGFSRSDAVSLVFFSFPFLVSDLLWPWLKEQRPIVSRPAATRVFASLCFIYGILIFGMTNARNFIYFQY